MNIRSKAEIIGVPSYFSKILGVAMNSSKDAVVFNNTTTKNPLQDEGISVQEFSENYLIVIRYINLFFCCTAVLGNSSILLTIWKTSSLHSVSNILLSSLAVSDLSIGLVVQPIFVAHLENLATTDGLLYFNILGSVSCTVSFYSVTAIAVDRLLAVQLHLRYEAEVTPFRATVVVIIIWIYAALFSVFWLLNFYLVFKMISIVIMCILIGNFAVHLKIYLIVLRHQRQHIARKKICEICCEYISNIYLAFELLYAFCSLPSTDFCQQRICRVKCLYHNNDIGFSQLVAKSVILQLAR